MLGVVRSVSTFDTRASGIEKYKSAPYNCQAGDRKKSRESHFFPDGFDFLTKLDQIVTQCVNLRLSVFPVIFPIPLLVESDRFQCNLKVI